MYQISYTLFTGTVVHRARSAKAALEALDMLSAGGAHVVRIVVSRTGKEITVIELRLLAKDEA